MKSIQSNETLENIKQNKPAADFLITKVFDVLFWSQYVMQMQQWMYLPPVPIS